MGPDPNPLNATITWHVEVLPVMPPKKVLVEDITGAWCVFCADGSLRHQQVVDAYPDAIGWPFITVTRWIRDSFPRPGMNFPSWPVLFLPRL